MLNAPIGFRDEEGTVNFYGRWCCCGYSQSMYHTFVDIVKVCIILLLNCFGF
jgi:hypothetical protein